MPHSLVLAILIVAAAGGVVARRLAAATVGGVATATEEEDQTESAPEGTTYRPELHMFVFAEELDQVEDLSPWPGKIPVTSYGQYRHFLSGHAHDTLMTVYAIVAVAHLDGANVWNRRGHGGCVDHWDSPCGTLSICNAADGNVGSPGSHPNLSVTLPSGGVVEATWDELGTQPRRATVSVELDAAICGQLLQHARQLSGIDDAREALDHPDLHLTDRDWIAAQLGV